MRISKHFTLAEFTVSQTAARKQLDNTPPPDAIEAIAALCANVLDPLRDLLRGPVVITSGYRSPEVNKAVGGSKTSQHCSGEAADIICPGRTVAEVALAIQAAKLPFDQLINEFGEWVHVSYCANNRKEVLLARRDGKRTVYEHVEGV